MKLYVLITSYAIGMALANLCLKWASQNTGMKYFVWFAGANLAGFTTVIILPYALKLAPSNVVYAMSIGGGFCLLQLTTFWIFREPLSQIQWVGVFLIMIGIILLQWKPAGG